MRQGSPISRLQQLSSIRGNDILIVSEYSVSSDSLYYTRGLSADTLENSVSADMDVEWMKAAILSNAHDTSAVSADYNETRTSTDDFGEKFEENEGLTRLIPEMLSARDTISAFCENDALPRDILRDAQVGTKTFRVQLSCFAKNHIETSAPLIRFEIPGTREGKSRHAYIHLVLSSDASIFFGTTDGDSRYHTNGSWGTWPELGRGEYTLDVKEVRPSQFFVSVVESRDAEQPDDIDDIRERHPEIPEDWPINT